MELVWPAPEYLPSYVEALRQGWSPNNLRPEAAREELDEIGRDASAYLARQIDLEAKGPPVILVEASARLRHASTGPSAR